MEFVDRKSALDIGKQLSLSLKYKVKPVKIKTPIQQICESFSFEDPTLIQSGH